MWTDTDVPGRDVVESERWGIAPSLAFGLGTPTRVTLSYLHLTQDNLPDYGLPWVPVNTNPELAAVLERHAAGRLSNFYGLHDPRLRGHEHRRRHRARSTTTSRRRSRCAT